MLSDGPILVWFRRDLRLVDNPALCWAAERERPVIPFYVLDKESGGRPPGGASRWWLHGSLQSLDAALISLGSRLVLRRGSLSRIVPELMRETGAVAIAWNRVPDPAAAQDEKIVGELCRNGGLQTESFPAALLFDPGSILTSTGTPFRVFTPFWRKCLSLGIDRGCLDMPRWASPARWPESCPLDDLELRRGARMWDSGLHQAWRPGESGAWARLEQFLPEALQDYRGQREAPGRAGTSRISPHLHFGETGPRRIVRRIDDLGLSARADPFLRQLGWREFCQYLLHHFPQMTRASLRPEFDRMPWRHDSEGLRRWQKGTTGYPLVDAGMRELRTTGWMHNRVRMVTASFLTKNLLVDWRKGADWFLDTLVDADAANNAAGWQWVAGSGADAAPWFRIFNPVTQSRRFDPRGLYLRRWLPELRALPDKFIHEPWKAPPSVLSDADVELGRSYPLPMVDLQFTRKRALMSYRVQVLGRG